jgi:BirA family transcriptional regulator, biotin operon repressor / biotin---[acetyl-CoA-carboxylase] ligase
MYSKEDLSHGLNTSVVGSKFFVFDTIDSTNACARTLGDAGTSEGAVVVSEFQTNGRGRLGRSWIANPGENILFSVLLRPRISIAHAGLLTLFASVAIARAVERHIGKPIECKWPNDLLLNGRKLCGILLENLFQQSEVSYAIIGAGINVNQRAFPNEIAPRGTSLAIETGRSFDRVELLQAVLVELDTLYPPVRQSDFDFIVAEWIGRCTMFGKPVTVQEQDHTVSGIARRLNHDAGLVIETGTGLKTVYAGDVSVLS